MSDGQVTVVVAIRAKPGSEARVQAALQALLVSTRSEQGCINFDMHQAIDDPCLFLFYENWESQANLDRHFETPHIKSWLEESESLLAEPMNLSRWRPVR